MRSGRSRPLLEAFVCNLRDLLPSLFSSSRPDAMRFLVTVILIRLLTDRRFASLPGAAR